MKKVGQIIYHHDSDNLPKLNTENVFGNSIVVYNLGIYGLPGTAFRLNNSNGIMKLNNTGVLQIDATTAPITSLTFVNENQPDSQQAGTLVIEPNQFISIDYIYEDKVGGVQ